MTNATHTDKIDDDGTQVIRFIHRNRKFYLFGSIAAIVAGLVLTLLITPKYMSYGVFFPVYNNSIESVVDNPVFGYDVEADRMIQILYAEEVIDSCNAKFKLYERFGIDPNEPEARDLLKKEFLETVNFSRSPYVSIIVSATTPDPQFSSDLVNYILSLCDGMRNRIYKKNIELAYVNLKREYQTKKEYLDELTDSVANLRSQTNVEVVSMINNQVVLKSSGGGNSRIQTELERVINSYLYETKRLNDIAERLDKAKTQFDRPTTKIFVLQQAKPSYYKASPSLIVNLSVSLACGLLFITGFRLLREKLNGVKL
ncbi:MAG: hypothetical protein L6Q81_01010 [Bacteroidia bacterium]|nr:hypothetical protein [Bacteroidia bacterium]